MRWLILLLAACTTFEPVPRDTCGNGVLEPGEDCDSSDPSCVRCSVVCTAASDCPDATYACGVDGLCHAPGGALDKPVEGGLFLADDYRVTDVDHDGIGDVLGMSRTSLVVKHGDVAASLARTDSLLTPSQTGPGGFGDLDNDGSLDVTLATADGLVSYASPYGTLSPLDVQSTISGTGGPVDVRMGFPITPVTLGAFIVDNGQVLFAVIDFGNVNNVVGAVPCAPLAPADFSPDLVDVYQVNQDTDTSYDTVIALTSRDHNLCALSVHKDNLLAAATITQAGPQIATTITAKPVLADLDNDGDRCPDLITSDTGPRTMMHYPGAMSGGHCLLGTRAPLPPINDAPGTDHAIGHATFAPAALGTGPDALVLPSGIWTISGNSWTSVYASPRPLARAVNGDVDGDGWSDVVLAADGADDLDVLYRSSSVFATFQLYRVDTAATVSTVTLGDFDGDGQKDIDYTERVGDHERMMVAYGDGARVGTPTEVGTFSSVVSIARITLPTSNDPLLQISDLLVLQPGSSGQPTLTFLLGSPQRVLLPYFDPRVGNSGEVLRTAVVGSFGGGSTYRDILAIGTAKPGAATVDARAWRIAGPPTAFDGTTSAGTVIAGATDCSHDGGTGFCAEDATYLAFPAGAQDTVVAIDPHGRAAHLTQSGMMVAATEVPALAASGPPTTLTAADLDGDGAPELIATFDGALLVCTVDASGAPAACTDVSPAMNCLDAAPARLGTGTDLVALCHDGTESVLYRIHDGAADVLARSPRDLRRLRVGDVDGDGLDDIVAAAGEQGEQSLLVFPQCSSRDLTCGGHR